MGRKKLTLPLWLPLWAVAFLLLLAAFALLGVGVRVRGGPPEGW